MGIWRGHTIKSRALGDCSDLGACSLWQGAGVVIVNPPAQPPGDFIPHEFTERRMGNIS
jgi:hypothetical protein